MAVKKRRIDLPEMGASLSEQNSAAEITIDNLPEEMLVNIFSYLPLSDRKNARLVCHLWHRLSYSFSLIHNDITLLHKSISLVQKPSPCSKHVNVRLEMKHINKDSLSIMGNSESFWENNCKNLRFLDLVFVSCEVTFLPDIFQFLPLLEHIVITEIGCSNGGTLPKSFSDKVQFPNLRSLNMDGKSPFLIEMLKAALMTAPKLVSVVLTLSDDVNASEESQTSLNLDFTPIANLKEIYFKGIRVNDFITGMDNIFGNQLKKLTLLMSGENIISYTPLNSIISRCVNLNQLVLNGVPCSKSHSLIPVMNLNLLTTIAFGGPVGLTDDMVASLAVLNNLARFSLFCTTGLSTRGITEVFGMRPRPEMVELRLENVLLLSNYCDIMVNITPNLPNLKVLFLSKCTITNQSLESIIEHNLTLQCLTLVGEYVQRPPYTLLSNKRMSRLVHLDVSTTNIPASIIQNLELPSLKYCFSKFPYRDFKRKNTYLYGTFEKNCSKFPFKLDKEHGRRIEKLACCQSPFMDIIKFQNISSDNLPL